MLTPDSDPQSAKPESHGHERDFGRLLKLVTPRPPKISLGQIMITSAAHAVLPSDDVVVALRRHMFGDWGMVGAEDWKTNDERVLDQGMILSAYDSTSDGRRFWVISDPGHETTTVLLPEDY